MTMSELLGVHRLVVCVGTGGVGKTTTAAALAIEGARLGLRVLVLTIDPARALARAFGFERLSPSGERISPVLLAAAEAQVTGTLDAAMLDQEKAWDALVRRYAPSQPIRDAILRNPFYQELSRRFPGSTEYVAMEEVARLHASGSYDLIVLDTPPAEHALDFVRAPARLGHLLTREVEAWAQHPVPDGRARGLVVRLVKAIGGRTFREVVDFFSNAGSLMGAIRTRSEAAQELLRSPSTAFVLITSASEQMLAAAGDLAETLMAEGITLKAAISNRSHPLPGSDEPEAAAARATELLQSLGAPDEIREWLATIHRDALTTAHEESQRWSAFRGVLPAVPFWTAVPELDHDVCSLHDLVWLAARLDTQ